MSSELDIQSRAYPISSSLHSGYYCNDDDINAFT